MISCKDTLQVLYEDNHLLIVNKRSGDISQADKTGDAPLSKIIKQYLKQKYNKPGEVFLGTVHRLDRPTTGILIYAKTSKALERLSKMFRDKEIKKTYWAVVKNCPKKNKTFLINFLRKNAKFNKSFVCSKELTVSKQAVLYYRVLKKFNKYALLEVKPETGRHHQIRVQLSHIGHPIKGDLKYGAERSNKDGSILLHAQKIEFIHPVSKKLLSITAPTPKAFIFK